MQFMPTPIGAQYAAGVIQGEKVKGYLEEERVPKNSVTETYAAMKLFIDNWRWAGVPFYLRTGKRLAANQSTIAICFKQPPQQFFAPANFNEYVPIGYY
jgi:glucose-6-phosphate 1-dehydrogenase